jgi:hypothetical protein
MTMRRVLSNGFAFIGALTVMSWVAAAIQHRVSPGATGIVMGANGRPAFGVPVFLDRGRRAIERYVTDSAGEFRLPLEPREMRRAIWLICVPGLLPMVGTRGDGQLGPTTYYSSPRTNDWPGPTDAYGWYGPSPRECPPLAAVGWRYPANAGKGLFAFSVNEPDWNTLPATPRR